MIHIYFEDYHNNRLGAALFGAIPEPGDQVTLRLTGGVLGKDGGLLPLLEARFRVESAPQWVAFNHDPIMEWMTVHRSDKEAYAIIIVSALNEDTQKYIDSIRAQNDQEAKQ